MSEFEMFLWAAISKFKKFLLVELLLCVPTPEFKLLHCAIPVSEMLIGYSSRRDVQLGSNIIILVVLLVAQLEIRIFF